MRGFELRPAPGAGLSRPANRLLIVLAAALLVALLTPWVLRPLVERWTTPAVAPVTDEAWPAAPPTYAPPTVALPAAILPAPTATPLPPPVWRELSYLTTIEYTAASVVEVNRKTAVPWLGEMTTNRLLLRAVGTVQMGVDLSKVKDVTIDGTTIRFVAPMPVVTSVELLPEESQIYDHQQVLFLSQSSGIESEALEKARQQLRQEIGGNESMNKLAQEFARLQLTEFLRKAGFTAVEITFE
ncbi:MAG: hypothetical protein DCC55_25515 [Chloroflexi bacterium]|nr:MAG: hypothetical protein DCC55_25515 [Chloroflexota bacterium]